MKKTSIPKIEIGYRWGSLEVECPTKKRKSGYIIWRCRCICGNEVYMDTRAIQRGTYSDCGCITRINPQIRDLSGQTFGHLTALQPTEQRSRAGSVVWRCLCKLCEKEVLVAGHQLIYGYAKSCGDHAKKSVDAGLVDGTSIRKLEYYRTQSFPRTRSGYTGVYQERKSGKWIAHMQFQGKVLLNKKFASKEDAIQARKRVEAMIDAYLEAYYAEHPEWNRAYYTHTKDVAAE